MKTVKNSSGREYQEYNGICYHPETPEKLVKVIDGCLNGRNSIRVYLGDVKTGKCWNEEHDVRGRVGRSMGSYKIPLLCHPLSYGGGSLLDHCILKIVDIKSKRVLYQAANFIQPEVTIKRRPLNIDKWQVLIDGKLYAHCKTERQAKLLRTKMS